jgi:hypothetical protein
VAFYKFLHYHLLVWKSSAISGISTDWDSNWNAYFVVCSKYIYYFHFLCLQLVWESQVGLIEVF